MSALQIKECSYSYSYECVLVFSLRIRERSLNTIIQKLKILFMKLFLYLRNNRRWLILSIYPKHYTSSCLSEFANFLSCHWVRLRNFHSCRTVYEVTGLWCRPGDHTVPSFQATLVIYK